MAANAPYSYWLDDGRTLLKHDVLFLAHRFPCPPDKGDRIRTYHLLRFLSSKARLHVACLRDERAAPAEVARLECFCHRLAVVPLGWTRWLRAGRSLLAGRTITEGAFQSPALRRLLRAWAADTRFDACVCIASSMTPYLQDVGRISTIVDLVDVDSQKWLDYAATSSRLRGWLYRLEATRLRRLEQRLPGRTAAVTVVSRAEQELYRGFCSDGLIEVVPNGVDLDYFQPGEVADEPVCVFVGALDYRPNVDGIAWFCREVWPEIRRRRPEARLLVVGRRPVAAVRRLAAVAGVEVVGAVPDVRPYLRRAAVVLAPLRIARGIQNKVLEALAMARAVAASPAALAGIDAEPGVHLLSATTPAEWHETIASLLDDPSLRRRLGDAGRSFVEAKHRWDRCLEPFARLLGLGD